MLLIWNGYPGKAYAFVVKTEVVAWQEAYFIVANLEGILRTFSRRPTLFGLVSLTIDLKKTFSEEGLTSRHTSGQCLPKKHRAHVVFGGMAPCAASVLPSQHTVVE
jgi:hypothetical protein